MVGGGIYLRIMATPASRFVMQSCSNLHVSYTNCSHCGTWHDSIVSLTPAGPIWAV